MPTSVPLLPAPLPIGPNLVEVWHEIILTSVTGKNNYTIPVGNMFLDASNQTTLDINQGSGWIEQGYGPDYSHLMRSAPGTPPSVVDAAIGFSISGGAVVAGWGLRFRWVERRLVTSPISIAKVMQPPNYAVIWGQNTPNYPNGILVPEFPDAQVEFWRQTWRDGGVRGRDGTLFRQGKRYLPYFRGPAGQFRFAINDFAASQATKRNHFKVCYYLPNGARSSLSTDTIVVCSDRQPDQVNGRVVRTIHSLWIE